MEINAKMVKELRDKTDAGMMDCKKALAECNGDMQAAIEYLRKAGIANAGKRADKVTKEGKIYAVVEGGKAVMIEVLCETDFVASNEKFYDYVKEAAARVLAATSGDGDVTEKAQTIEADELAALFTKFGEKMVFRRALRYETAGQIGTYMHGEGRVGVMVDVEGEADAALLKSLCLHIAAYSPTYVDSNEVPAEAIAKEKEIAAAQLEGKPANIIEKILDGKIQKWFSDICLVKQPWIHDDKSSFEKLYPKAKVKRFARWTVGQEL